MKAWYIAIESFCLTNKNYCMPVVDTAFVTEGVSYTYKLYRQYYLNGAGGARGSAPEIFFFYPVVRWNGNVALGC